MRPSASSLKTSPESSKSIATKEMAMDRKYENLRVSKWTNLLGDFVGWCVVNDHDGVTDKVSPCVRTKGEASKLKAKLQKN